MRGQVNQWWNGSLDAIAQSYEGMRNLHELVPTWLWRTTAVAWAACPRQPRNSNKAVVAQPNEYIRRVKDLMAGKPGSVMRSG